MIIIRFKAGNRDTVLMMYINRGDVSKSELLASWTSTSRGFLKSILHFPTSLVFLDKKMLKAWKWYQHCLSSHPVKTQIVSSGTLWGIGDIGAQYITHSTATSLLPKSVTSLRIGFFSIFYNWYFLFLICHLGICLWIVFFSQLCQLCLWTIFGCLFCCLAGACFYLYWFYEGSCFTIVDWSDLLLVIYFKNVASFLLYSDSTFQWSLLFSDAIYLGSILGLRLSGCWLVVGHCCV